MSQTKSESTIIEGDSVTTTTTIINTSAIASTRVIQGATFHATVLIATSDVGHSYQEDAATLLDWLNRCIPSGTYEELFRLMKGKKQPV